MSRNENPDPADSRAVEMLQAMADPVRFALLRRMSAGPVAVSDLALTTGNAQSKVSNHLALLRRLEIVRAERIGRQMHYEVCDRTVAEMIETLVAANAGKAQRAVPPVLAQARTCYDHMAGQLGVALFDSLVARRAIRAVPLPSGPARKVRSGLGVVALGDAAEAVFARLGVDIDGAHAARRQFATACLDWTENRPHLGGALGAAMLDRLLDLDWIERMRETRALRITQRGRRGFSELGLKLPNT